MVRECASAVEEHGATNSPKIGIFDVCFTKKVKSREKNERSCGRIRVVGGDLSSLRSPSTEIGSRARQEDAVKSFQRG